MNTTEHNQMCVDLCVIVCYTKWSFQ